MDADELVRQDRPAIINWKYRHWCVFAGRDEDGRVSVCNPDIGRFRMSEETFKSFFTGLDSHPGQGVALTNGEPRWLGVGDHIAIGEIFEHDGALWRATQVIVRGEEVIEGYNAVRVSVAAILTELESSDKSKSEE